MSSCDSSGNPRAEATLAAYLSGGRLPHAILVEGRSGTLAFAKKIGRAALCGAEKDKPCGVCRDCVKTERDVHPDLLVYSGGDRTRSFHIDTVRELRQEAFIKPNEAETRVFILENVQNMTVQAQNALLKIIEEPPKSVTFVLTCENKAVLLETVLSRVSVLSLDESVSSGDGQNLELRQKAGDALRELIDGSELAVLAAFAPFERDRAGFQAFITELRSQAAGKLSDGAKAGTADPERQRKLMKTVEIIDGMELALAQNVGGLLLTTILPAKLKLQ